MNADSIRLRFAYYVANHAGMYPPSQKGRGVYVGALNKVCKGDANRKLFLKYLTGKTSTKQLTDGEWIALKKMVDISPVELERIVGIVLGECVKQEGQLTLADAEASLRDFVMNEDK